MFWIPVSVIFLCVWLVKYTVDGAKTARFQRNYEEKEDRRRLLAAVTGDAELERRLSRELDKKYAEWRRIVREFMGGSEEWEVYTGYVKGKLKAMTVLMAKNGKLPSELTSPIGFELREYSDQIVDRLGERRIHEMNEEFLFAVEDCLRGRGVSAVAMCKRASPYGEAKPYVPLRKLVLESGSGSSGNGANFRFTHQ